MITPANALKLSMWLALNHPQAFQAVLNQVVTPTQHRVRVALGSAPRQGTYIPARRKKTVPRSHQRGRFGAFGDDFSLSDISSDIDISPIDVSDSINSALSDPVLEDINVDIAPSNFDLSSAAASTDSAGGFWSSIGSGLSSIGSGVASAVGAVAGAVLNPQTLAAAGNLAATVIKANGATTQQQALLQAQLAGTASGAGVHPVTYVTNPATGQPMAMVYNPATGQYQAAQAQPASVLSSLFGASSTASGLSAYLPVILIGGGVLLTVALASRR